MNNRYLPLVLAMLLILYSASAMAGRAVCPGAPSSCEADTIIVPLMVDEPNGIRAFGFKLQYDFQRASYLYTMTSTYTEDWLGLDGVENSPGNITIGGFHTEPITASSNTVTLCFVAFRVISAGSGLSVATTTFADDLAGAPDCSVTVCTVPSNEATWGHIKNLWGDN